MSYHPYQPQHPHPQPPPRRGLSITALVLGILSILGLWVTLLAPLAGVIVGHLGYARERDGQGMALAGLILSWLSVLLSVVVWLALIWFIYASVSMFGDLYQPSDYSLA